MTAYMALSQKLTMDEKARFWAGLLTEVKAAAKAAQAAPVRTRDRRLRSRSRDTIHMLRAGPKTPTTEETVQSR